jgi:hypothetical protein
MLAYWLFSKSSFSDAVADAEKPIRLDWSALQNFHL